MTVPITFVVSAARVACTANVPPFETTQGIVDWVTPTVPETPTVGGLATIADAMAEAVGGVRAVIVAVGSATGTDDPATCVPISKSVATAVPIALAEGGVKVVICAVGRKTLSAPPETAASSVGLVGSAITMVSLTTVLGPMVMLTASRN